MSQTSANSTTLTNPISVAFKEPNQTGLEPALTLGTIAITTGDQGTSRVFVVSDGNTAFALDTQEYAHLTYPVTATDQPAENAPVSDMLVRSLSIGSSPVSLSVSQDHKWKGLMEHWRATVDGINQAQGTVSLTPNTGAGRRWVPVTRSMQNTIAARGGMVPSLTGMAAQHFIRTASGPSTAQTFANRHFDFIETVKPLWD